MENIKQSFNPEKEVHDAYEKFVTRLIANKIEK